MRSPARIELREKHQIEIEAQTVDRQIAEEVILGCGNGSSVVGLILGKFGENSIMASSKKR
jgi:hypothetical protein